MLGGTQNDNHSPPSLDALREELQLAIIDTLDIASVFALSQVDRHFNRLANPFAKSRRHGLDDFLVSAQTFPRWQDGFACFLCLKVLPRNRFADRQTKSPRGRDGAQQRLRYCIDCGVSQGRYCPGSMIVQRDNKRILCRQCKQLKGGRFCEFCAFCSDCYGRFSELPIRKCEEEGPRGGHCIIESRPDEEERENSGGYYFSSMGMALRMRGRTERLDGSESGEDLNYESYERWELR